MLSLHLLLLTTGVQSLTPLEEDQLPFQLNVDGYIECYDDLDCPNPVEVAEDNTISQFSCSGKIKSKLCTHFAQGKYILSQLRKTYDSTIQPENTKCARRQSGGTFSSHQKYELDHVQLCETQVFKFLLYGNVIFDTLEQSSFQKYATS